MKYYTPELDEFHVGFEYEILLNSGEWEKSIFIPTDSNFLHRFVEEASFIINEFTRVKYLDEQDIKDLGWKVAGESKSPFTDMIYTTFKITNEVGFNTGSDYYLVLTENNRIEITVFEYSSYGGDKGNLFFNIKNKSELRKLMKQIGIIQ